MTAAGRWGENQAMSISPRTTAGNHYATSHSLAVARNGQEGFNTTKTNQKLRETKGLSEPGGIFEEQKTVAAPGHDSGGELRERPPPPGLCSPIQSLSRHLRRDQLTPPKPLAAPLN